LPELKMISERSFKVLYKVYWRWSIALPYAQSGIGRRCQDLFPSKNAPFKKKFCASC
jgi:hypothetical protein